MKDGKLLPSDSHDVVNSLGMNKGCVVVSNQRYVSTPGGWHGWSCSAATALLMATDYDFGLIMTGSVLGSTLLNNGKRYYDRFKARRWHGVTGNYWQSCFEAVGLPMFSPVCGASELITMKSSLPLFRQNQVVYCMSRDGHACGLCTKCFRREIIRAVVDEEYTANFDSYNRPAIHAFLETRPLYFGHIFSYAKEKVDLPSWIDQRISDIQTIKTDWPMAYDYRVMDFLIQPKWKAYVNGRLRKFLRPMTSAETNEMTTWGAFWREGRVASGSEVRDHGAVCYN